MHNVSQTTTKEAVTTGSWLGTNASTKLQFVIIASYRKIRQSIVKTNLRIANTVQSKQTRALRAVVTTLLHANLRDDLWQLADVQLSDGDHKVWSFRHSPAQCSYLESLVRRFSISKSLSFSESFSRAISASSSDSLPASCKVRQISS